MCVFNFVGVTQIHSKGDILYATAVAYLKLDRIGRNMFVGAGYGL